MTAFLSFLIINEWEKSLSGMLANSDNLIILWLVRCWCIFTVKCVRVSSSVASVKGTIPRQIYWEDDFVYVVWPCLSWGSSSRTGRSITVCSFCVFWRQNVLQQIYSVAWMILDMFCVGCELAGSWCFWCAAAGSYWRSTEQDSFWECWGDIRKY